MANSEALWPDSYQIHPPIQEGVQLATLLHTPPRMKYYEQQAYLARILATGQPSLPDANWTPRTFEGNDNRFYVPRNTTGITRFTRSNALMTDSLNGCTAVAAAYRDPHTDVTPLLLGHYDAENVRQTHPETGRPILSSLVRDFAGSQAVRVAVVYAKEFNPSPREGVTWEAEDYPVDAMIQDFGSLPPGSSVLRIPYNIARNITKQTDETGHVFYVERAGSDLIKFGFNSSYVRVGEPEEFTSNRQAAARVLTAALEDHGGGYYDLIEG